MHGPKTVPASALADEAPLGKSFEVILMDWPMAGLCLQHLLFFLAGKPIIHYSVCNCIYLPESHINLRIRFLFASFPVPYNPKTKHTGRHTYRG